MMNRQLKAVVLATTGAGVACTGLKLKEQGFYAGSDWKNTIGEVGMIYGAGAVAAIGVAMLVGLI